MGMADPLALVATALKPLFYPVLSTERVFWLYLLSGLTLALLVLAAQQKNWSLEEKLAFCFPKDIYTHPSARADYRYFYINTLIQLLLVAPLVAGLSPGVSALIQAGLMQSQWAGVLGPSSFALDIVYTLLLAIMIDFGIALSHYLQHKVPVLWEFHKTHHSAEVLTPMTVYRMHPVDDLLNFALSGLFVGCADGLFQSLFSGHIGLINVYGLNLITFLFYLLGYNLRHSHIWVDYGPFWSRIFISPAQHQIHHSTNPAHYDKNLGFIFAWWDQLFGTLYVPQKHEPIEFGINRHDEHKEYHSVRRLYWLPFQKAWAVLGQSPLQGLLILGVLGLGIIIGLIAQPKNLPPSHAPVSSNQSVYLEDLTSPEVRDKIHAGTTTVIIPTGGTEQNGAQITLGKHNQIVRYTTGEIATQLGNTLVAPVLAYVPEAGHMAHAGTIDLPEADFKRVLTAAATSLKHHGFKWICFVGDSGWNQDSQKRVAQKLNQDWKQEGVHVLAVNDYYFHKMKDLSQHAGVQDTSEMMVVWPSGIREGNPSASEQLGEQLLQSKINAGVRQIRQAQNTQTLNALK